MANDKIDDLAIILKKEFDRIQDNFDLLNKKIESEISSVRSDLGNEISSVRSDMNRQFSSVASEFSSVASEFSSVASEFNFVRAEFSSVRADIRRIDQKIDGIAEDLAIVKKRTFEDDNAISGDVVKLTEKTKLLDKRVTKLELAKI